MNMPKRASRHQAMRAACCSGVSSETTTGATGSAAGGAGWARRLGLLDKRHASVSANAENVKSPGLVNAKACFMEDGEEGFLRRESERMMSLGRRAGCLCARDRFLQHHASAVGIDHARLASPVDRDG